IATFCTPRLALAPTRFAEGFGEQALRTTHHAPRTSHRAHRTSTTAQSSSNPLTGSRLPIRHWSLMNRVVCLLAVVAAASLGPVTAEVSGDAWLGEKPAVDAVIWLEAPDAPRAAARQAAVMDLRNM